MKRFRRVLSISGFIGVLAFCALCGIWRHVHAQTATTHTAGFFWNYTPNSDAAVSMNVYRGPSATGPWTLIATVTPASALESSCLAPSGSGVTSPCYGYTDNTVVANTTYFYEEDQVDSKGNLSGPSPVASGTTGSNPNPASASAVATN